MNFLLIVTMMEYFIGIYSKTIPNSTIYCYKYRYNGNIDDCNKLLYISCATWGDFQHIYLLYAAYMDTISTKNILNCKYLIFMEIRIYLRMDKLVYTHCNIVYLISNINYTKYFCNLQYYINYNYQGHIISDKDINYNQYLTVVHTRDDIFSTCNLTKYLKRINIYCNNNYANISRIYVELLNDNQQFRSIKDRIDNLPYILDIRVCNTEDEYEWYE